MPRGPFLDVKLYIDDVDFSYALSRCRFVVTTRSLFPLFSIHLTTDPTQFLTKKIYDSRIKLNIISKINEQRQIETIFNLLPIQYKTHAPERNPNDDKTRFTPMAVALSACDKDALHSAIKLVNSARTYTTIEEVLQDLCQQAGVKLRLLTPINGQVYKQILVPPLSLNKALVYLQTRFGITKGPLFRIINYKRELVIGDAAKLVRSYPKPIIIFSRWLREEAYVTDQKGGVQEGSTQRAQDLENRYAFRTDPQIKTRTAKMLLLRKNKKHVIRRPLDSFYSSYEIDVQQNAKQYAVGDYFEMPQISDLLKDTEEVISTVSVWTGEDEPVDREAESMTYASSFVTLIGILERFYNHKHFLYDPDEYGFVAIVKDTPSAIQNISGRYLLAASDLTLFKEQEGHWSYQISVSLKRSHEYRQ